MLVKFYTEDERFIEEGTVEEPFTDKHVGQQVTLDTVWRVVRMLSDGWEPRTGEVFQQVVLRPDEVGLNWFWNRCRGFGTGRGYGAKPMLGEIRS